MFGAHPLLQDIHPRLKLAAIGRIIRVCQERDLVYSGENELKIDDEHTGEGNRGSNDPSRGSGFRLSQFRFRGGCFLQVFDVRPDGLKFAFGRRLQLLNFGGRRRLQALNIGFGCRLQALNFGGGLRLQAFNIGFSRRLQALNFGGGRFLQVFDVRPDGLKFAFGRRPQLLNFGGRRRLQALNIGFDCRPQLLNFRGRRRLQLLNIGFGCRLQLLNIGFGRRLQLLNIGFGRRPQALNIGFGCRPQALNIGFGCHAPNQHGIHRMNNGLSFFIFKAGIAESLKLSVGIKRGFGHTVIQILGSLSHLYRDAISLASHWISRCSRRDVFWAGDCVAVSSRFTFLRMSLFFALLGAVCSGMGSSTWAFDVSNQASPPPPGARTAIALLDTLERDLVQSEGQRLSIRWSGHHFEGVFYAPLSTLWLTDAQNTVRETWRLDREGEYVRISHDDQRTLVSPAMLSVKVKAPGVFHPLAEFHDRLIHTPLIRDLATIPAGSQFRPPLLGSAHGIVLPPNRSAATALLWTSTGDHIHITTPNGVRETLDWRVVDAALAEVSP